MSGVAFQTAVGLMERGWLPDVLTRRGIRSFHWKSLRDREGTDVEQQQDAFRQMLGELRRSPIAVATESANEQHYELPVEFFNVVLGPHKKYSGCYWPMGIGNLEEAEEASLCVTCEHAELIDGQRILELGCGWGSLTMWMARQFPHSEITAVSNSHSQREFITSQCQQRSITNVNVVTADINDYAPAQTFDRVVSVEMFEHMRNHEELMRRIAGWLSPDGKLFVHIFVHSRMTYLFESEGSDDWMGRYFFTGGIMPADTLLHHFQEDLLLQEHWRQDGTHYEKTANAWLSNMDYNKRALLEILGRVYGNADRNRWFHRWRIFFIACAELFGSAEGKEWWVSHYLFRKRQQG